MAKGTGQISWDPGNLAASLQTFNARADRALFATMKFHATRGRSWMKTNAPWTDRTSNARNGLDAVAERPSYGHYRIIFFHGVPYGIWLEVANDGRFAVIGPAIEHEGPEVMSTASKLFAALGTM